MADCYGLTNISPQVSVQGPIRRPTTCINYFDQGLPKSTKGSAS